MDDDGFVRPRTPRKGQLKEPISPSKFVTPISGTMSSIVSSEDIVFAPGEVLEQNYEVVDLQAKKKIPLDVFLVAMGVPESSLEKTDGEITAIASNNGLNVKRDSYCNTVGELDRYGPFCEYANHILSQFSSTRIIFTRNDPRLLDSSYTKGGLKPDVIALDKDFEDVKDDKWMQYSLGGPVKKFSVTWTWMHAALVAEFKKRKDKFPPKANHVSFTLTSAPFSPSVRLTRELRRATRTQRMPDNASDHGSSRVSTSSSKRLRRTAGEAASTDTTGAISCSTSSSRRQGAMKRGGGRKSSGRVTPTVSDTRSGSKGTSKRGSSGKSISRDRPVVTTTRSNSAPGSGRGDVPVPPILTFPPPVDNTSASERRKRAREEMVNEGEEADSAAKLTAASNLRDEVVIPKDLEIAGAKYAIDLMSHLPNRRHLFELLIYDGVLRLAYYDRAGPLYSEPFYFTADVYRFVLLLKALAHMDVWELGFLECMKMAIPPKEKILEALTAIGGEGDAQGVGHSSTVVAYSVIEDARLTIRSGAEVFTVEFGATIRAFLIEEIGGRRHYGLISRGTSVHLCYLISPGTEGLFALKLSWPQAWRTSEADILRKARVVLRRVDADPEHRRKYGDRKLEDSLPSVIMARDLDELKKEQSFRWATQRGLYEDFDKEANRICRVIVMELLRPLHSVTTLDHFKEGIRDIVLAHHFLYVSELRILHRDISLHNLMVRYYPGTDKIHGVLIDFDLTSLGPPTTEGHFGRRTGTRPYMARELLRPETPIHLERYDWESFFYVICWVGSHYSNGDKVETDAFKQWDEPDDTKLRGIKTELLFGSSELGLGNLFTDFYKPLITHWIKPLQRMFRAGDDARDEFKELKETIPEDDTLVFDEETGGGRITWDRFWGIIMR